MAKRDLDFAFGMGRGGYQHGSFDNQSQDSNDTEPRRSKKRRSRWQEKGEGDTVLAGLMTTVPAGLSKDQEEQYLLQLQIEEISRRLRTGDLGIPTNAEDRSPSPEPIYNNEGKRLNTRDYRTRRKLEERRHELIQKQLLMNDTYKPPADYKPPLIKVTDKVPIPQEEHPDINFVGLLIGPRGNTLKNLEKETGAKIIIRGKGSVKEGKIGRKDGQPMPGEDEPLHAYITAGNPEFVVKAVQKIKEIIRQGIEVPEQQNDLRRQQLRELALLNGTLRENDSLAKLRQLQQAQTIITNTIMCSKCGGAGHIASDCKAARPGDSLRAMAASNAPFQSNFADRAKMDSEYSALMAELGEGPPPHPLGGGGGGMGGGFGGMRTSMPAVMPPSSVANVPPLSSFSGLPASQLAVTPLFSRSPLQLPAPQQQRYTPMSGMNSNNSTSAPTIRPLMGTPISAPWQLSNTSLSNMGSPGLQQQQRGHFPNNSAPNWGNNNGSCCAQ